MSTKICKQCNEEKDSNEFGKNKKICKKCDRKRLKEYRTKNKDKIKEQVRLKYLEDPLKHILQTHISLCKTHNIPCDGYEMLYSYLKPYFDIGKCEFCSKQFTPGNDTLRDDSPSIDRLIPKNGYVIGNLAVLCGGCNRKKNNNSLEDLEKWIIFIKQKLGIK